MSNDKTVHDDLRALAHGINHILTMRFAGVVPEFLLVIVSPEQGEGTVVLNTITAITEPDKIHQVGQHLIDMANAQRQLDPDSDNDVRGHA